jgi:hypothetical protein
MAAAENHRKYGRFTVVWGIGGPPGKARYFFIFLTLAA